MFIDGPIASITRKFNISRWVFISVDNAPWGTVIPGHNQLLNDAGALEAAQKECKKTRTGPLATFGASAAVLFSLLPRLHSSPEFHALPNSTKAFLQNPNRPSTEIWMLEGPLFYRGPCPATLQYFASKVCARTISLAARFAPPAQIRESCIRLTRLTLAIHTACRSPLPHCRRSFGSQNR